MIYKKMFQYYATTNKQEVMARWYSGFYIHPKSKKVLLVNNNEMFLDNYSRELTYGLLTDPDTCAAFLFSNEGTPILFDDLLEEYLRQMESKILDNLSRYESVIAHHKALVDKVASLRAQMPTQHFSVVEGEYVVVYECPMKDFFAQKNQKEVKRFRIKKEDSYYRLFTQNNEYLYQREEEVLRASIQLIFVDDRPVDEAEHKLVNQDNFLETQEWTNIFNSNLIFLIESGVL